MADEQDIEQVGPKRFTGDEITVHGETYIRSGTCIPCEGCFNACVNKCPHGIDNGDGTPRCGSHEAKGHVCEPCTDENMGRRVDHQVCVDFPDNPFLDVIRSGVCAYEFRPKDDRRSMRAIYALFDKRAQGRSD